MKDASAEYEDDGWIDGQSVRITIVMAAAESASGKFNDNVFYGRAEREKKVRERIRQL
jgi:hypothetical protein